VVLQNVADRQTCLYANDFCEEGNGGKGEYAAVEDMNPATAEISLGTLVNVSGIRAFRVSLTRDPPPDRRGDAG